MSTVEERLSKVESELAIRNVIASYGLAADCGDVEAALACHTVNAVYIVSNPNAGRDFKTSPDLELLGHQAIKDMLTSERHQSLLPNCAHTVGPLVVKVDIKTASVLGYSRVYNQVDGHPHLMRVAFNTWNMCRENGTWKISRRESRIMGEQAAQNMLRQELAQ